jgi:hypothetical protein
MLATYSKTLSFNILALTHFLNTTLIEILTLTFKTSIIAKRFKGT